jgi:hypothetical protein
VFLLLCGERERKGRRKRRRGKGGEKKEERREKGGEERKRRRGEKKEEKKTKRGEKGRCVVGVVRACVHGGVCVYRAW